MPTGLPPARTAPSLAAPPAPALAALLKRLNLASARRRFPELIQRAEHGQWSYYQFLRALAEEEVAHRAATRLVRYARQARFPELKTVEEFDFSLQPGLRPVLLGSCFDPGFAASGSNLILAGKSGRGKTHRATAIAYKAIQNGSEALFASAAAMLDDLSAAARDGRLRAALNAYTRPHVLVVDELGYLAVGDDAANLLERGRLVTLGGPSMRTRHLEDPPV